MKQFLKFTFASAIGVLAAGGILMFIFFLMVAGAASGLGDAMNDKKVSVKDNSVLHLTFSNAIVDRAEKNPFEEVDLGPFQGAGKDGLDKILKSIDNASKDSKIKGIFLEIGGFPGGMAQMEEVRDALNEFKAEGKWIISYSESYSQGGYYLASVSDKVYLNPKGSITFKGLSSKLMFFKGLLEKLDIEAQIIRGPDNKYKSAMEPFMYDQLSDANEYQLKELLGSVWENMLTNIEASRGVKVEALQEVANNLSLRSGDDAVKYGFVDGLKYKDEITEELLSRVGVEDEDDMHLVGFAKYKNYSPKLEGEKKSYEIKDKVAVIYAEGEIRSGKSNDGVMGSATIAKAIKDARKDSSVKAIVLRVNSPGGSALASDVMWRETQLAKKEKPLVVSMGNLAASGGYYISCGADKIYADHNTITGSIGVFGMVPNINGFMENKMGITFDEVKTNDHSDWGDILRPMDDFEKNAVQEMITQIYDTFLLRVATGRNMTVNAVDSVAQGRVWTGTDAIDQGLVDEIGGLDEAIAYAVEKAGLEEYKLKNLPEQKDPFEEFVKGLSGEAEQNIIQNKLGKGYVYLKRIEQLQNMQGIQARLPFYLDIE